MSEEQNGGEATKSMSFAEKYASKKRTMTSQQLQSDNEETPESASEGNTNISTTEESDSKTHVNTKIDPRKKMQAELIYLVKGIDAGRNAWYYVLVDRLKVQLFLKALNDEIIHLENYGKILFSAYGEEPPAEITSSLKEEYGIS